MSIRRRWIATCDAPGCEAVEILTGDQFDGKWTLGELISDRYWQASPAVDETFCPEHAEHEERFAFADTAPDSGPDVVEEGK